MELRGEKGGAPNLEERRYVEKKGAVGSFRLILNGVLNFLCTTPYLEILRGTPFFLRPSPSQTKTPYLTSANRLYAAKAFNLMDWNLSLIA